MANKEETYEPFGSNVSEEELTEEYGGLGKSVFICKKEDFERKPGQPYINEEGNLVTFVGQGENKMEWEHREELMPDIWHEVSLVDDSYIFPSVNPFTEGNQKSKKSPRSFTQSFTIVDDKMAHYNAQMLAVTVLPVFSKSMLPVTLPHTPFQLRDGYTKLYRNPHNFFYSEIGNIYSSSFFRKKSEEEEEQLFENLETALNCGNLQSIRFRSKLFHSWLKSK